MSAMRLIQVSKLGLGAALVLLAGCSTGPDAANEHAALDELSAAPSHLKATSDAVHGLGCAYSVDQWQGEAASVLTSNWDAVGAIQVDGEVLNSADEVFDFLRDNRGLRAERAALTLNVLLNNIGFFGIYADLDNAQLTKGGLVGVRAGELLEGKNLPESELADAMDEFNSGFGGCDVEWFDGLDDYDADGVPDLWDCSPYDASIGAMLYNTDFSFDDGFFNETEQLPDEWDYNGTSVVSPGAGQQGTIGSDETYSDNYVVYAAISAQGTKIGCGFECEDVCGDYVPDDCYEPWEAVALDILEAESGNGVMTVTNNGDYAVCLDAGFSLWDADGSQDAMLGGVESGDESYRIEAGDSIELYYGSWTTENGGTEYYVGEPAWWCWQRGTAFTGGYAYELIPAYAPQDVQDMLAEGNDLDSDGVDDLVDYEDAYGVRAQYNVWEYQENHAMVVIGKRAAPADGVIDVTLTVQNRGGLDASGVAITDVMPANWELVSCDVTPSSVETGGGSTYLMWETALGACTSDCSVVEEEVITCSYIHAVPTDVDHAVLPQASVSYNDGDDDEVSYSMPAVVFNYDYNQDGEVTCGGTDRWRAGVLARAELDADQDEGYHGYRCAISQNSATDDCHNPGFFLQIAEFMDAPEDNISSECNDDCPANTTFDQLARTDFDGDLLDISQGELGFLSFYVVDDTMYCDVYNMEEELVASASATDDSFSGGVVGLSTLNMYGDYYFMQVCEAYSVPN